MIDRCVTQKLVHQMRNLSLTWIDYRKVSDIFIFFYLIARIKKLMILQKTRFTTKSPDNLIRTQFHSKEEFFTLYLWTFLINVKVFQEYTYAVVIFKLDWYISKKAMWEKLRRRAVDRSILRHLGSSVPKSTPTRRHIAASYSGDMMQEALCRKHEHRFQHYGLQNFQKNVGVNNLLKVRFY